MDNSLSLFAMASEWMENGNINEFIKEHPEVNRFDLVGFTPTSDRIFLLTNIPFASSKM